MVDFTTIEPPKIVTAAPPKRRSRPFPDRWDLMSLSVGQAAIFTLPNPTPDRLRRFTKSLTAHVVAMRHRKEAGGEKPRYSIRRLADGCGVYRVG